MVEIIWTQYALEDLQAIHDYIAQDSEFYATRFVNKLISRVDILINHPKAGKMVPEFENELLRELIEGNYRIIYSIESITQIGIVRIHHSARILDFM